MFNPELFTSSMFWIICVAAAVVFFFIGIFLAKTIQGNKLGDAHKMAEKNRRRS